ncbi:MAG: glycine cleavage system aminomethyltransferase GcvT [Chloroflexi bacterium]|nr:glycine cleavage system aminomethyltransferase GcvT [Chloroflexota bacterium]
MTRALLQLALRDRHAARGARFAPFAGWAMPVQYGGILEEHAAVRNGVGVFDVSHLGRVWVRGEGAGAAVRSVSTYDVTQLEPGRAHYSLYCTQDGGIADDVFVYHLEAERWLVVHNAANAAADYARLAAAKQGAVEEVTRATVMLAVQGPEARATLGAVLGAEVCDLELHDCRELSWGGGAVIFARTGYTGEDGGECITDRKRAGPLWDALVEAGAAPVGLGARDTLRLEAALPLHGNDIDTDRHPYEAGLGWAVTLQDTAPFTGREALVRIKERPREQRLGHLRALERGVPRAGYPVYNSAGEAISRLTSGAYSPTLRLGIGMAYLPRALTEPGTRLMVDVRGRSLPMEVVRRPFYKRAEA